MGLTVLTLFLSTIFLKDPQGYVRDKWVNMLSTFGEQQAALGLGVHINLKLYAFTNKPELCEKHRCWGGSCIYCYHGELEPWPNPADYTNPNGAPVDTDELLTRFLTKGDRAVLAKFAAPLESIGLGPGDPSAAELQQSTPYNINALFKIPNEYRFYFYFVQYKARALLEQIKAGAGTGGGGNEHAVLLGFINGDIVFRDNVNLMRSLVTVMNSPQAMRVPRGPVLMVGKRINVVAPTDNVRAFFVRSAQDFFFLNNQQLEGIGPLPRSKMGGVVFDNWFTDKAWRIKDSTGVDLSLSAHALHLYTAPDPRGSHGSASSVVNHWIHRSGAGFDQ
jgi:hypothetical protein